MQIRCTSLVLIVPLCILAAHVLHGQPAVSMDSSYYIEPRYGMYGTVGFITHDAHFQSLPNAPSCCTDYNSANGTGASLGFIYEHPVAGDWLLGGRLICETVVGAFKSREPTTFIINGVATDGAFEHKLDVSYTVIGLQPLAGYRFADRLFDRVDAVGHLGLGIGTPIVPRYNQSESIVEPHGIGIYTESGSVQRNTTSGDILDINPVLVDVRIGLTANIALNRSRTLLLAPELWYVFGLSRVVRSLPWHTREPRIGLALKYILADEVSEPVYGSSTTPATGTDHPAGHR